MQVKPYSNVAKDSSDAQLPEFKAEALLSLTKKINANLSKPPPQRTVAERRLKTEQKKTKVATSAEISASPTRKATRDPKGKLGTDNGKREPTLSSKVPQKQGKKRLRDGHEKGSAHTVSGIKSLQNEEHANHDSHKTNSKLQEDILALGGTLDDYRLVAEVDSNSEMEGNEMEIGKSPSKISKKELLKFVRDLGIDKVVIEEAEGSTIPAGEEDNINENNTLYPPQSIPAPLPPRSKMSKTSGAPHLSFEPQSEWHSAILTPISMSAPKAAALETGLIDRVYAHAKSLLELENKNYALHTTSASSTHRFYSTIMSSGTLSDKISALTLSVQESPVHNMKALESLVGLARKRSRSQAVQVLGALKDLFGPGALLPSDRKLKFFTSQPGIIAVFTMGKSWVPENALPAPLTEGHLVSWAYEDWLKSIYFEVLTILETWCNDEIAFAKSKAIDCVYQLLKEKPEQEANLLRLLINKLGDTEKKIASKASYNILQLEKVHFLMKPIIISAIESDFLFRPGQTLYAKYYAVITLNQTLLSVKEESLARKLIDIYFSLFVKLLERPNAEEKLVVTGPNKTVLNSKGEVQGGGGVPGRKAQRKKAKEKGISPDEELREKMLSAVLTGVNRAMPYTTTDDEFFEHHLGTLFKVTHSSNFNTSIQALMLIQQLSSSHPRSTDRFYRTLYESLLDPRLLTSSKQALYLNLLFKALKSDVNLKRVKAFSKRLLQVVGMNQPSFACGALYLLREIEEIFRGLHAFIDEPDADESDEEENFRDIPENASDNNQHQFTNGNHKENEKRTQKIKSSYTYDGRKRDPEYSNAERSCLWELVRQIICYILVEKLLTTHIQTPLLLHFHPSVCLFASRLISHEPMPPKPDLSLHTLVHFLDDFVKKNPKKAIRPSSGGDKDQKPLIKFRGESIMQPAAFASTHLSRVAAQAYYQKEQDGVAPDEVFFHKYYSIIGKGKEKGDKKKEQRRRKDKDGSEDADDDDDDDEDEIWQAIVDSKPELDGSDQTDDELNMGEPESSGDEGGEASILEDDDDSGSNDGGGVEVEEDDEVAELGEDDEELLDSDEDAPTDLEEAFGEDDQAQLLGGKPPSVLPEESKRGKKRRKMLKNLPTFASADDYAEMLKDDDE